MNVAETAGCANVVARSWLSGRCCEGFEFVTVSVEIQSEEFLQSGCESREGHMREFLSSFIARVLRRLGGVLCSPCVLDIHRFVRIPGQCNCTLLSAPLLMRSWHSLRITIKDQTTKHSVHWTPLLRAFPYHGSGTLIVVLLRSGTGSQRVTFWDDGLQSPTTDVLWAE